MSSSAAMLSRPCGVQRMPQPWACGTSANTTCGGCWPVGSMLRTSPVASSQARATPGQASTGASRLRFVASWIGDSPQGPVDHRVVLVVLGKNRSNAGWVTRVPTTWSTRSPRCRWDTSCWLGGSSSTRNGLAAPQTSPSSATSIGSAPQVTRVSMPSQRHCILPGWTTSADEGKRLRMGDGGVFWGGGVRAIEGDGAAAGHVKRGWNASFVKVAIRAEIGWRGRRRVWALA